MDYHNVSFACAKNVYYELKLLKNIYQRNGFNTNCIDIILGMVQNNVADWSITDLYNARHGVSKCIEEVNKKRSVFVFFNSVLFEEFVNMVAEPNDNLYTCNLDTSKRQALYFIRPISERKNARCFNEHIIQPTGQKELPSVVRLGNQTVSIEQNEHGGSEAYIYPLENGNYIKIYQTIPCGDKVLKLEILRLQNKNQNFVLKNHFALPESFAYDSKERVRGFSMKAFRGKETMISQMHTVFKTNKTSKENSVQYVKFCKKVLSNLIGLLLDLSLNDVYFADLNVSNVLIDPETYEVYLVDVDSCQVAGYHSRAITNTSIHPDCAENYKNKLRRPYHFNFALAVLAFQLYVYNCKSPLVQRGSNTKRDEDNLVWDNDKFPGAVDRLNSGLRVTEDFWMANLNDAQRNAFIQEFTFEKIHSLGDWIEIFGLYR